MNGVRGDNCKPSSFVVVRNQLFDDRLNADEPDGNGPVDEWRSGPEFIVNKAATNPQGEPHTSNRRDKDD